MPKEILERKYKPFGYLNGKFRKLGFILENLGASQTSYFCIRKSNEWLQKNFGTNITIFFRNSRLPCTHPNFAYFHIKDVFTFNGILICTSINDLICIKDVKNSRKIYYIQDLEMLRDYNNDKKEYYENVMRDKEIIKICRSKDHFNYLKTLGYDINYIIEDFNIDKILEVINENQ